jgi:hypothetical protein
MLRIIALSAGFGWLALAGPEVAAQTSADRLRAEGNQLEITVDGETRVRVWNLDATLNPDVYTATVAAGATHDVCFVSGPESLCRRISSGGQSDFVITHEGVDYPTRIVTRLPAAVFDAAYQEANRGRIQVLVPEVYELVNIAIALTPKGRDDRFLISKEGPYYEAMMSHFGGHLDHPLLAALEDDMARDVFNYFKLKTNGYAFEFDGQNRLIRSSVYDRIGFGSEAENYLLPYLALLQDFADKTDFRAFYKVRASDYEAQIQYYSDQIDVAEMLGWLQASYPAVRPYDGVKILFSPLVASSQSLSTLESNGYRELQPHVNFPYPSESDSRLTAKNVALRRGLILFTEMNHGFINPVGADAQAAAAAFAGREVWATSGTSSDAYRTASSLFNEYVNWSLASLYFSDQADPENLDSMIASLETTMGHRGFRQFGSFNQQFLKLYRERAPGVTVADLYPELIRWSAAHQAGLKTGSI